MVVWGYGFYGFYGGYGGGVFLIIDYLSCGSLVASAHFVVYGHEVCTFDAEADVSVGSLWGVGEEGSEA